MNKIPDGVYLCLRKFELQMITIAKQNYVNLDDKDYKSGFDSMKDYERFIGSRILTYEIENDYILFYNMYGKRAWGNRYGASQKIILRNNGFKLGRLSFDMIDCDLKKHEGRFYYYFDGVRQYMEDEACW